MEVSGDGLNRIKDGLFYAVDGHLDHLGRSVASLISVCRNFYNPLKNSF